MKPKATTVTELRDTPEDLALLARVYERLYARLFPVADERESLENMADALRRSGQGGPDRYHLAIAFDGPARDAPGAVGIAIADYLAEANAGMIEFVAVDPGRRGSGLGTELVDWVAGRLEEDARAAGGAGLAAICAELEDPELAPGDGAELRARAAWWGRRGFRGLDFPYVQPALSEGQRPVRHLMLMARCPAGAWGAGAPSEWVGSVVRAYVRYAMRRARPEGEAEVREMLAWLGGRERVGWVGLDPYGGRSSARGST